MIELTKEQQQQTYKKKIGSLSDEFIDWLKEKDLSIVDFENLINFTRERFTQSFSKKKIKDVNK